MNSTGTFPVLTDSDTIYTLKQYSEALAAALGQGAAWSTLAVINTAQWRGVSGYPIQIMAAGKVVQLRGMVATMGTGVHGVAAVTIPPAYRPAGNQNLWLPVSQSTNLTTMPLIQNGALIPIVTGYFTGAYAAGAAVSITGTWLRD